MAYIYLEVSPLNADAVARVEPRSMVHLLPGKAVGPAHPAARKGGWARIFIAEELHAKGHALGHGYSV